MLDRLPTQANSKPLIALRNVGKTYANGVAALEGISLVLAEEPQFLALVGQSGCGKSTLLRILAGLDTPSSGTVERGPDAALIGYVFQDATLMPWASVFENVYLPLRIKGIAREAARPQVEELLARVGLSKFSAAYPRQLSGGMRMRVSTARALVTKPRLLLMDEPFAALDEITRLKIERDLLDLWQTFGFTVIFVTHSVFEAAFMASRVVVMSSRPGSIASDLALDAPYPRTETFRTSSTYIESCRRISGALAAAMGEAI
jgi:NitT/TauT family transport system ATP-binding protein